MDQVHTYDIETIGLTVSIFSLLSLFRMIFNLIFMEKT